jgi:23S rRNA (adenine1618-N6)-methyltransferase
MSIYNKNIIDNEFKPDFLILIQEFPELKKYIIKEGNKNKDQFNFDWSNNELSLLMTKSILNYYFNIKYYDIPKGYLIPPVPSRLNYINFINILLNKFNIPKNEDILGIDIGTGANIIYPLIF